MNATNRMRTPWLLIAVTLAACIFGLDVLLPIDFAVWLLFLLPVFVMYKYANGRHLYLVSLICTGLILIGLVYPLPMSLTFGLTNRIGEITMLWIIAVLLSHSVQVEKQLRTHEDALERQVHLRTLMLENEIGQRKQVERALREREKQYRLLADNAYDMIWTMGADTKITYMSPSVQRIRGFTPEEVMRQSIDQIVSPVAMQGVQAQLGERLAAGVAGIALPPRRLVCEQPCKDGSMVWTETFASTMFDADGTFMGLTGVTREITERKRAEDALRASEERLRLVLQNSADVVTLFGCDGIAEYVSPAIEGVLGVTQATVLDRESKLRAVRKDGEQTFTKEMLLDAGYPPMYVENRLQMFDNVSYCIAHPGERVSAEMQQVTTTGEHRVLETVSQAYQHGTLGYEAVCTTRDITGHKRIEDALGRMNEDLERRVVERTEELTSVLAELRRLSLMKDEFMSAVNHELRTPLSHILALSETLELQFTDQLTPQQLHKIRLIRQSGLHLLEMITSILEYTDLVSGSMRVEQWTSSLASLFSTISDRFADKLKHKQQTLDVVIEPANLTVTNYIAVISSILAKLLDNAIKFSPNKGRIGLEARVGATPDTVELVVWDTGIGIREDQLHRIYRPFMQGDGTLARQYEGLGLGLAYVQQAIELLGGAIQVDSTPGQGSRFTVVLPNASQ